MKLYPLSVPALGFGRRVVGRVFRSVLWQDIDGNWLLTSGSQVRVLLGSPLFAISYGQPQSCPFLFGVPIVCQPFLARSMEHFFNLVRGRLLHVRKDVRIGVQSQNHARMT